MLTLAQLEEIGRVLAYPKIRKILRWDDEAIGGFLRQISTSAPVVQPAAQALEVRDLDDLHVLQTLAAGAESCSSPVTTTCWPCANATRSRRRRSS